MMAEWLERWTIYGFETTLRLTSCKDLRKIFTDNYYVEYVLLNCEMRAI